MANISPEVLARLRDSLADLYPDQASARRVASDAGLDIRRFGFHGSAINTWSSILDEARLQGRIEALAAIALREYPNYPALRAAAESLRSGTKVVETPPVQTPPVTALDLSSSQVSHISDDILAQTSLTSLDLSNNQLTSLPDALARLQQLGRLNLSDNRLSVLPPSFFDLTGLGELFLSGNQLTELPPAVARLRQLTRLSLANNQLVSVPDALGQLPQLTELDLSDNQLSELPASLTRLHTLRLLLLRGNRLGTLGVISDLAGLTLLDLDSNQLSTLPPEIGRLTAVQVLRLRSNQLAALPPELGRLTDLRQLDLRRNQLSALPPGLGACLELTQLRLDDNQLTTLPADMDRLVKLEQLGLANNRLATFPAAVLAYTTLRQLDLGQNEITALPADIGRLPALTELDLSGNRLTELPSALADLTALERLDLRGNPLPIPPEILENVSDPRAILAYYFEHLAAQKRPLNEAKVLLVGQGGVGKTSLVRQLVQGLPADPKEDKTRGIEVTLWPVVVDGQNIRLHVWDFGGQEIMHATHQFFLTQRSLYLLVLDARLGDRENHLRYWLKLIESFGGDSPIIIVGNKVDLHPLDLNQTGLKAEFPGIKDFVATSCGNGTGIDTLASAIKQAVAEMPHVRDPLPVSWLAIKARLEQMRTSYDYMSYADFERICQDEQIVNTDDQETVIRFLHNLGIVLNYRNDLRLEDTSVLNPEWVTSGVYRILNSNLLFQARGVLGVDQLDTILPPERYPRAKHLFILNMMQKFELCFPLDDGPIQQFLIPDLLGRDEPYTGEWRDALAFQFDYDVLPNSVFSRFMVRMNRFIQQSTYWRTGVVLAHREQKALVKADLEGNRITVLVHGPVGGRRDFLGHIRFEFEGIHKSLSGIRAAEKVPIPGYPDAKPVDYQYLLTLEEAGIAVMIFEGMRQPVSVRQLLDGVVAAEERRAARTPRPPPESDMELPKPTDRVTIRINERGVLSDGPVVEIDGQEFPFTLADPLPPKDEQRLAWYYEQHPLRSTLKPGPAQDAAASVRAYGVSLFEQVFRKSPDVYARYHAQRQAGLDRVTFEIAGSPEFQRRHWEMLRDPKLPQPLACQAAIVRRELRPRALEARAQPSPTLNVLLVTARARGRRDVAYRTLARPLVAVLRQIAQPVQLTLLRPGTYRALADHLERTRDEHGAGYYHLIHFDCHGELLTSETLQKRLSAGQVVGQNRYGRSSLQAYDGTRSYLHLESDQKGKVDLVEAEELANLLITHQVPLVVLTACQSGQQVGDVETSLGSRLMLAGMQTVLAMAYTVTVSAAQVMMRVLYEDLLAGRPLNTAVGHARRQLYNDKQRRDAFGQPFELEDWPLPVVYQNKEVRLAPRPFTTAERVTFYQALATSYQAPALPYAFTGRDLDILYVERRLLTQHNLLLLRGLTGSGKTALLHHLGEWWQATRLVEQVFYFDFHAHPWTRDEIMETMAQALFAGRYAAEFGVLPTAAVRQVVLARELRARPHLLLLDGFEAAGQGAAMGTASPAGDARRALADFFAALAGGKTLVVLAARDGAGWLAATTLDNNVHWLDRLDPEAAASLAGDILRRAGVSIDVEDPELAWLLDRLDGHAQVMADVLGQLATLTPAQLLAWLDRFQPPADVHLDHLLAGVSACFDTLDTATQGLLANLAPFTIALDRGLLADYAGRLAVPAAAAGAALDQAVACGLALPLAGQPAYVRLHPLLTHLLRTRLDSAASHTALRTAFIASMTQAATAIAQGLTVLADARQRAAEARGDLEYENLAAALLLALETGVPHSGLLSGLNGYFTYRHASPARRVQNERRGRALAAAVRRVLDARGLAGQAAIDADLAQFLQRCERQTPSDEST